MIKKTIKFINNCLPDCLWPIKVIILKKSFFSCGKNVKISKQASFIHPGKVSIGNDVFLAQEFYTSTIKNSKIGNRVMFGPRCAIIGGDHNFANPLQNMRHTNEKGDDREIIIEDDSWIGFGTLILKRARICEGSIIGAMSVVNSYIEPYCVYAGNPAKKIKPRFKTYEDLLTYLEMMKNKYNFQTKYTNDELRKIYEND